MIDYSSAVIYQVYDMFDERKYIGWTTMHLGRRLTHHKNDAINNRYTKKEWYLHKEILAKGPQHFIIIPLERPELETKEALDRRVQHLVKLMHTDRPDVGYN